MKRIKLRTVSDGVLKDMLDDLRPKASHYSVLMTCFRLCQYIDNFETHIDFVSWCKTAFKYSYLDEGEGEFYERLVEEKPDFIRLFSVATVLHRYLKILEKNEKRDVQLLGSEATSY